MEIDFMNREQKLEKEYVKQETELIRQEDMTKVRAITSEMIYIKGQLVGIRSERARIRKIILKLKNPYPEDIFIGTTETGKYGKFGHMVFKNTIEDVLKTLEDEKNDRRKGEDEI
jgi:hypothetical protein